MSNPKEKLNDALKQAMKNKDIERRDTLRLINAAIKQVEVDERRDLSDEEIMDILQKEAKKYRETISELENTGRTEEAQQRQFELNILEEFLPRQLTREEIVAMVDEAIAQTGASSPKEMGKVMGVISPQTKGRADGKLVSEIVREKLQKS